MPLVRLTSLQPVDTIPAAAHIVAITPSDSAQANTYVAIVCLTAGNAYIKGTAADTPVCVPMVAGQILDVLQVNFVMATGPTTGSYAGVY